MDGVSSAFAVVSLAIQLVDTVQEIRDFLRNVQNAPNELIKLVETLEQLHGTLTQVKHLLDQQYSILRLPGSPVFMQNALQNCNRKISTLEEAVNEAKVSLARQSRVKRTWAAMKLVYKKEDIQEMQTQLLQAETGLQTAMLSNSWQLQMHHITIANSSAHQAVAIEETFIALPATTVSQLDEASSQLSYKAKNPVLSSTKEIYYDWYRGLFGIVAVQTKSKYLERSDSCRNNNRAVLNESVLKIKPSFMRQVLELRLAKSFGRISPTLSIYHVVEWNAPIFRLCENGDLQGLRVALGSGGVSPFVVDENGRTLLHWAVPDPNLELCDYLLQIGVDSDHGDNCGRKAISQVGHYRKSRTVDTLRLLIRNQDEMSSSDLELFWKNYWGPVEGAEFIFNQNLLQYENPHDGMPSPPLLRALWEVGFGRTEWEPFLRRLIRSGASLHTRVGEYSSLLDELYRYTGTPFDGEKATKHWLQILKSEGYDVLSYLKEELDLRAGHMQLNQSGYTDNLPRQLIFHWESDPFVSWDWWIDPDSPISLICDEYKHIAVSSRVYHGYEDWEDEWKSFWPFTYSAPLLFLSSDVRIKPCELAQKRFNRRAKKRSNKLARAQGSRARSKMPGAWPV